jgi:hypothetical protein
MGAWVEDRLGSLFSGPKGRLRAFEVTLVQAKCDGVTRLEIGEDVWAITLFDHDAAKLTRELPAMLGTYRKPSLALRGRVETEPARLRIIAAPGRYSPHPGLGRSLALAWPSGLHRAY